MKKIIFALLFLIPCVSFSQIIVNLGTDAITGKKTKAQFRSASTDETGAWKNMTYFLLFYESDNTPTSTTGGTLIKSKVFTVQEYSFQIKGVYINTSTKVILSDTTGINPKSTLQDYMNTKLITSYPGVSNSSAAIELTKGKFKELLTIMELSGLLP